MHYRMHALLHDHARSRADDGARRAARAGRRHDLRGRGDRRRRRSATGEVVFNTVLSGYQEVITDPSYAGQIITFTYPHIGNYGVNLADFEARRPFCRGVVVRDLARRRSSWRSEADLDAQLRAYGVPGIAGIDTRKLTRRIRDVGAIPGAFGPLDATDEAALLAAAHGRARHRRRRPRRPGHHRRALPAGRRAAPARGRLRLRHQAHDPAPPRLVVRRRGRARRPRPPPTCSPATRPGVFLSNGPGDPAAVPYASDAIAGAARQRAGVRDLPRPPAARPGARRRHREAARSATTAATTRCATSPPARSRSPARTTTSRSTPTRSPAGPR